MGSEEREREGAELFGHLCWMQRHPAIKRSSMNAPQRSHQGTGCPPGLRSRRQQGPGWSGGQTPPAALPAVPPALPPSQGCHWHPTHPAGTPGPPFSPPQKLAQAGRAISHGQRAVEEACGLGGGRGRSGQSQRRAPGCHSVAPTPAPGRQTCRSEGRTRGGAKEVELAHLAQAALGALAPLVRGCYQPLLGCTSETAL